MNAQHFAASTQDFAASTQAKPLTPPQLQYSIGDLLQYTTVCAVLLAAYRLTGLPSAILLAAFALALGARWGLLAAWLFVGALAASGNEGLQGLGTLLVGFGVLAWYRLARWRFDRAAR